MIPDPTATDRSRVLVIDDEPGPRLALKTLLEGRFCVRSAAGGEEALEIVAREPVDVVTLDLHMPGIDGLETLARIREILPDVEVVIVTGFGSYDAARDALRLRAFDFIAKPFDAKKIHEVVEKAAESARTRSAFLANMGHELRTPLNVILGFSSLVVDYASRLEDTEELPPLDAIERSIERLVGTIRSVGDLSMIDGGSFTLQTADVDVVDVVEKELRGLAGEAQRKGLWLYFAASEPNPVIRFDSYCLSQAVRRLVDNAIKFTERGGVAVQLGRDDQGCLRLEIRDTGVGISAFHFPRLFHKFQQEEQGTTRTFDGLGIGLALAKRFLERNGAWLSVESEKGKGSVFRIHFPEALESPAPRTR